MESSKPDTDARLLCLHPNDNILVLLANINAGETLRVSGHEIKLPERLGMGHKLARTTIKTGEKVLKYGFPIGTATKNIQIGEHIHLANLKSNYTPTFALEQEHI